MNYITPIFDTDIISEIKSYSLDFVKTNMEELESLMATKSLGDNLVATLGNVYLSGGAIVTEYEAKVVGRFRLGEDLIVILADGHHFNVSELVRRTIETHES